jgi:hypothetical protein
VPIEVHALGELLDAAVRRLVKHTAPRLAGQSCFREGWTAALVRARGRDKNLANMFTVNSLRQKVNAPQAPAAQKLGTFGRAMRHRLGSQENDGFSSKVRKVRKGREGACCAPSNGLRIFVFCRLPDQEGLPGGEQLLRPRYHGRLVRRQQRGSPS